MTEVTVTARRWSGGWELWNEDDCWTQVRHLTKAVQQVRDYLDTVHPEVDHSNWSVTVLPADELTVVVEAREAAEAAREAAAEASAKSRQAVAKLLSEGISTTDTAVLMGISKGRVSQLASA
ncbi:MAG: antitoxin HicB [Ancrocorticia sp.]